IAIFSQEGENSKNEQKKREANASLLVLIYASRAYIIPPIPPPPIGGIAGASSFTSAITHSVVNSNDAIEAAFSRARRVTLVGSITPAANRSSNLSVLAL